MVQQTGCGARVALNSFLNASQQGISESANRRDDNDRPVRTVSSEQVRRPIFREGLTQWRDYERWLDPLKAGLGPALDHWR